MITTQNTDSKSMANETVQQDDLLTNALLLKYLQGRGIKMSLTTIKTKHADISRCPPSAKIGRTRYFKRTHIDKWIDEHFNKSKGDDHAG